MAGSLTYQVLDSLERFRCLRDHYIQATQGETPRSPFTSHRWLSAWWQAFAHTGKVRVFCLMHGTELRAAVPLMFDVGRLWRLPLRRASFLGGAWGLIGLPASPKADSWEDPFFSWLSSGEAPGWDFLELGPMRTSTRSFTRFLQMLLRRKIPHKVTPLPNPYLTLTGSWDEFLRAKSGNFRSTVRRKEKRLLNERRYTIQRIPNPTPEHLAETVFEVSRQSWQGRSGEAVASRPEGQAFYRFLLAGREEFEVDLTAMRTSGCCVTYLICLHQDRIYHQFDTGFDPKFSELSPGFLVHVHLLKDICSRGILEFNLGYPQPYKERFEPNYHESAKILVFRNPLIAALSTAVEKAKEIIRGPSSLLAPEGR